MPTQMSLLGAFLKVIAKKPSLLKVHSYPTPKASILEIIIGANGRGKQW